MPEKIILRAADGHELTALNSTPEGACLGGIVVLHAVFGLTSHIGDICDKWAALGFRAIAPALFDRLGKDIIHPYGRDGAEAGAYTYRQLLRENILSDIQACHDDLLPFGHIAISGFCTGGSWAWTAAAHLSFSAQVAFYGSHIHERLSEQPLCPTQLHYGSADHVVPKEERDRIIAAHPSVEVYNYDGVGHAFMNPDQEFFDANSATIAWTRAAVFIENSFKVLKRGPSTAY